MITFCINCNLGIFLCVFLEQGCLEQAQTYYTPGGRLCARVLFQCMTDQTWKLISTCTMCTCVKRAAKGEHHVCAFVARFFWEHLKLDSDY